MYLYLEDLWQMQLLKIYDKMQRCNNNNNNNNNNSKRCTQKYLNGNIATATAAAAAAAGTTVAATAATANVAGGYQQHNNSNKSNAARKARYNNNKRQDGGNSTAAYNNNNNNNNSNNSNNSNNMQQKRSNVAGATNASWHRFVTSSCIEEKFLGQHNPGHRNSTSSEATSEDINSSDEHANKIKTRIIHGHSSNNNNNSNTAGGSSNNKSRSRRQHKAQAVKQALNRATAATAAAAATTTTAAAAGQLQPLEMQPAIKVNSSGGSKFKQGKWRNSNSNGNTNSNTNSNSSNNTKRSSSHNNNKSKQTKCSRNSKTNANNSSGNNNSSNNNNAGKSIVGNYSSNSSSALSSPGSSPNSSSSSSSGNSSSNSGSSISTNIWQRDERHKSYKQNANFLVPPLRQYERLDLDDAILQQQLQRYLIEPHLLRVYGFPVESVAHEGAIEIFKCLPHMNFAAAHVMSITETALTVINCHDGLNTSNFEYSSNQEVITETIEELECSSNDEISPASTSTDSGNISPRSLDSESGGEWSGSECESSPPSGLELYCNYAHMERSLAKQCVRCKHDFLVDELSGQYLTRDECSYHWGKYHRWYDGKIWSSRWTCCNAIDEADSGCTRHELHVWTGSVVGVNGPYSDFVHTRPRSVAATSSSKRNQQQQEQQQQQQQRAVYALDCEMSYTGRGLDVTKVSLVALNGQLVYEHYVRPDADIVDYNTRYSGVTAKDLKSSGVKTLAEVQRDLLELIDADTILIGHGLDNDLRALRLVHNTLIDTSITFPHSSGFPYRRALRHLTKTHLNREIQSGGGATGHSSFEDSRACMELMLWRVHCELDSDGS